VWGRGPKSIFPNNFISQHLIFFMSHRNHDFFQKTFFQTIFWFRLNLAKWSKKINLRKNRLNQTSKHSQVKLVQIPSTYCRMRNKNHSIWSFVFSLLSQRGKKTFLKRTFIVSTFLFSKNFTRLFTLEWKQNKEEHFKIILSKLRFSKKCKIILCLHSFLLLCSYIMRC